MKRRPTYLLTLALLPLLLACSPQRRLAHLLAHHPELRGDTIITLRDTIATPYASADTVFVLPTCADSTLQPSKAAHTTGITVVAGNARATLAAEDDGRYRLTAESLPDTMLVEVERHVPLLVTKTEKVQQPITKWQAFKMQMGGLFIGMLAVLLLLAVLKIVRKFV